MLTFAKVHHVRLCVTVKRAAVLHWMLFVPALTKSIKTFKHPFGFIFHLKQMSVLHIYLHGVKGSQVNLYGI